MTLLAFFVGAYLLGSIPFGKLFCLIGGIDIQKRGSGNMGYANVQRIMGWKYGIPTLICDIAKGAVPVTVVLALYDVRWAFWVGCAAIVGHIFPIWLKFRGGKGVATGLGLAAVLTPIYAIIGTAAYVTLINLSRRSSTASLVGIGIVAGGLLVSYPAYWWMGPVLMAMALYALRQNLFGKVPDYG